MYVLLSRVEKRANPYQTITAGLQLGATAGPQLGQSTADQDIVTVELFVLVISFLTTRSTYCSAHDPHGFVLGNILLDSELKKNGFM